MPSEAKMFNSDFLEARLVHLHILIHGIYTTVGILTDAPWYPYPRVPTLQKRARINTQGAQGADDISYHICRFLVFPILM